MIHIDDFHLPNTHTLWARVILCSECELALVYSHMVSFVSLNVSFDYKLELPEKDRHPNMLVFRQTFSNTESEFD